MPQPLTLFQKVWNNHVVVQEPDSPAVLYIDLQLVHEVTSPQAFEGLRQRGLKVRRPDRTIGTMDHSIPTLPPSVRFQMNLRQSKCVRWKINAQEFGFSSLRKKSSATAGLYTSSDRNLVFYPAGNDDRLR